MGRGQFFDVNALSKPCSVGIPSQNQSLRVSLVISVYLPNTGWYFTNFGPNRSPKASFIE